MLSFGRSRFKSPEDIAVLTHSQGHWGHASITSREEDAFGPGSQEDHGSRGTRQ